MDRKRRSISDAGRFSLVLVLFGATVLSLSCELSRTARLRNRAEEYYTAWKFKDYETMYDFFNAWGREQIAREDFVDFMASVDEGKDVYRPNDFEADYFRQLQRGGVDAFVVEEVYLQGQRGKVKLFLKTSRDLVGETFIDPNAWVYEEDQWRLALSSDSPLFQDFRQWRRRARPAAPAIGPGEETIARDAVAAVRSSLKEIEGKIKAYAVQTGRFPESLGAVPGGEHYLDPFSAQGEFRYHSDGRSFWIVAGNGPDKDEDIDTAQFDGFRTPYPPASLVYDPSTGEGDLYNYGPK